MVFNAADFQQASIDVSDNTSDVFLEAFAQGIDDRLPAVFRAENNVICEFGVCAHRECSWHAAAASRLVYLFLLYCPWADAHGYLLARLRRVRAIEWLSSWSRRS